MSIWSRIAEAIGALAQGKPLSEALAQLRTPPERSLAFTIAVIALGAKLAKADGQVTRDEISAFRQVFHIAPQDEAKAAQVFNLARQDTAGFEHYARQIGRMFADEKPVLEDLLEGLFHIAMADGVYHPNENMFLKTVTEYFGLPMHVFESMRARYTPEAERSPYSVLGVSPDTPLPQIRERWRQLVRESHPDRMIARGLPEEAVKMAVTRLVAINEAWEKVLTQRQ